MTGGRLHTEVAALPSLSARIGPNRLWAARVGLIVVGLFALPYIVFVNRETSLFGFDAHAYWNVALANLYGTATSNTSDLDAFRYTPAAGQAFAVFRVLPWEVFFTLWF